MSNTIVISDDEAEDEHKTLVYPSLRIPPENKPVNPFLLRNEMSSWDRSSTGRESFRHPLGQNVASSSSRTAASTTENPVADNASSNAKVDAYSLGLVSSRKWPSSQRKASNNSLSKPSEIIDLTNEDACRLNQKGLPQHTVIETKAEPGQLSVRQTDPTNTRLNDSDLAMRLVPLLQVDKLSPPVSTSLDVEIHYSNQSDYSLRVQAGRLSEPALPIKFGKSSEIPNSLPRLGRTIPWDPQHLAIVPAQEDLSQQVTVKHHFSDRGTNRSSVEREIRDLILNKPQPGAATKLVSSAEKVGRESDTRRSSPTVSRPRLKLNGPKRSASKHQDRKHASLSRNQERQSQNLHVKGHDISTASRVSPANFKRTLGIVPRRVEPDRTADSDSDDASVRMQRSIDQTLAKYSKQPSANVRKSGKIDSTILERQSGQGSLELGEIDAPADDIQDVEVTSAAQSTVDQDAPDVQSQSEQLSASETISSNPSHENVSPAPSQKATEASSKVVDVSSEHHQSLNIQETQPSEPIATRKCQNARTDIKLLEAIFKTLVEEMRGDQEDLISGLLSGARKDTTKFAGPEIGEDIPDPFAASTTSAKVQASLLDPIRRSRLESKIANSHSKASIIDFQAVAFKSETSTIPKYNSIVRLASNVLAPNDKELRYLPYFPSEEEKDGSDTSEYRRREELLEGFDNRIKFLPEERRCTEQAGFWTEHLKYFLEEVGCSCVDIMYYLLHHKDATVRPEQELSNEALPSLRRREKCCENCGTKFEGDVWDRLSVTLSEHKRDEEILGIAEMVCSTFSKKAKFSIWHVVSVDEQVQLLIDSAETKLRAEAALQGSTGHPLCMLCHVFDCPTHGAYIENESKNASSDREVSSNSDADQDCASDTSEDLEPMSSIKQTVGIPERPKLEGQQHRCSPFCVDLQTRMIDMLGLRKDGTVSGDHNSNQIKETGNDGFGDAETCSESCFWDISNRSERTIAEIIQSETSKRYAGWSDKEIALYKSLLEGCAQIKRGPCIMAITLARPCSVIFEEMTLDVHTVPHPFSELYTNEAKPLSTLLGYRYKDLNYWYESSQTYDHHKRRPFSPCSHVGPCQKNSDCSCWTNKVACEWICGCDSACTRRFQGCRCIVRGAKTCFKDSSCDCFAFNRECDPWLCGKCGVLEVLDPLNRYDDSILKGRCKNAMIQRGVPKRTLKGPSEVHGWGLFAGTDIRANEFIGEYKGEVISEEESNRRGLVYHYRGIEYLFRLNKEQEIDSSRAGNKMRFINNSERAGTINVFPQPMLCNGVQRIGLFAKRNLTAGEEMFFRYGYPESITKNFWEKEDLEAGMGLSSVVEQQDSTERGTTKGFKNSSAVAQSQSVNGVSKHMKKPPNRFAAKKRHAQSPGQSVDAGKDLERSDLQGLSNSHIRSKKRKRIPSSPVIDETLFDIHNDIKPKIGSIVASDPLGPSNSSFSLGVHASMAVADDSDEEYQEEHEDEDDEQAGTTSSTASASEPATDDDGGKTQPSASRRTVPSRQSTRRQSSKPAPRLLRTARASAATSRPAAENATIQAENRGTLAAANTAPPTTASNTTPADHVRPTISAPRKHRKKIPTTTSTSSKGSQNGNAAAAPLPYTGKKRGRPLGWKRGIDFK